MTKYTVETIDNAWSYIIGPNGYREGPIRYRWEAEEWAEEMNNGKPPPEEQHRADERRRPRIDWKQEKEGAGHFGGQNA